MSTIRARKVAPQDLEYFDLILAMDKNNLQALQRMCPPQLAGRIRLFMSYARNFDDEEVPDPFYGLGHGFDLVIDMVEDASTGLIIELKEQLSKSPSAKKAANKAN